MWIGWKQLINLVPVEFHIVWVIIISCHQRSPNVSELAFGHWNGRNDIKHEEMIFAKYFLSIFKLDNAENSYSLHKVTFSPLKQPHIWVINVGVAWHLKKGL